MTNHSDTSTGWRKAVLFIEPSQRGRCIRDDALALLAAKLCFYSLQKRSRSNLSLPLRKYGHIPAGVRPQRPRSVLQCIGVCMAASCQPDLLIYTTKGHVPA